MHVNHSGVSRTIQWLLLITIIMGVGGCSSLNPFVREESPNLEPGQVYLSWKAGNNVAGFNLYRKEEKGKEIQINTRMIAPVSGSADSRGLRTFEFTDRGVVAGKTYYYLLEEVDSQGKKTRWDTPRMMTAVPLRQVSGNPN